MTPLQTSIIYASIIGSIINEFKGREVKRAIEDIKKPIKKFMVKRNKSNPKEFKEALEYGNVIWVKAIDHYKKHDLKIDAFAVVVALYTNHAQLLSKHVGLTEKRIERFSMLNDNESVQAELDAYKVASFLNSSIKNKKDK